MNRKQMDIVNIALVACSVLYLIIFMIRNISYLHSLSYLGTQSMTALYLLIRCIWQILPVLLLWIFIMMKRRDYLLIIPIILFIMQHYSGFDLDLQTLAYSRVSSSTFLHLLGEFFGLLGNGMILLLIYCSLKSGKYTKTCKRIWFLPGIVIGVGYLFNVLSSKRALGNLFVLTPLFILLGYWIMYPIQNPLHWKG